MVAGRHGADTRRAAGSGRDDSAREPVALSRRPRRACDYRPHPQCRACAFAGAAGSRGARAPRIHPTARPQTMKLFWSPRSPFVRKVMVCAHELGLAERIEKVSALVSMTRVNPDVLKANPVGRIPALVTGDGLTLYDSNVICEYLDMQLGRSQLFPQVAPDR